MKTLCAPLDICLLVTSKCNLKCRHCLNADLNNAPELSVEEMKKVVRQIIDLKIFNVLISGGEPLMREDFFTIIDAFTRAKIRIHLFTNGTLITKAIARRLASFRLAACNVSLDGASAETHESIRGKGSFIRSIRGIKNLIAQGCPVGVAATLNWLNYREAEKIILLARRLGAGSVNFVELTYIGNASKNIKELAITAEERFELLSRVSELKHKYGDFVRGSISTSVKNTGDLRLSPKPRFPMKIRNCVAGTTRCTVRPDGWVTPCDRLWFLKAGDLKKEPLGDIWRSSPVLRMFRKPLTIKKKDMPGCEKCKYIRPCYLTRRCKPYFLFRDKYEQKGLQCQDAPNAC